MFQKKIPLRGHWPYWGIESRYDCNFMRLKLMFDSKACVSTFICVLPLLSSASIWGAPIAHLIKQHTVHKPTVKNRFKPSNCPPIDKEMKQTLHGNLSKKKQQNFGRKFLKDFGGKKNLKIERNFTCTKPRIVSAGIVQRVQYALEGGWGSEVESSIFISQCSSSEVDSR